jgi:hypothetical protein
MKRRWMSAAMTRMLRIRPMDRALLTVTRGRALGLG